MPAAIFGRMIEWCVAALRRGAPAGHLEPGIVSGVTHEQHAYDRRQRSRRQRGLPRFRSDRHLPDHPLLRHGGTVRRMGRPGPQEPVGQRPHRRRTAIGRRRRRHRPWRVAGRCPGHHLHGLAGPAVDDPQHVQDRRRTDADRLPCRRPFRRRPRPVHFRRPLRCDGDAWHRLRPPRLQFGPGGAGHGSHRLGRHARRAHPGAAFFRWLPHLARSRQDRFTA